MIQDLKFTHLFENGHQILSVQNAQNFETIAFENSLQLHQLPRVQKDKIDELQEQLEKAKKEKQRKEEEEIKRKQQEFEDSIRAQIEYNKKIQEEKLKKQREENPIETFFEDEFKEGKEYLEKYAPSAEQEIESIVEEIEDDAPDIQQAWKQTTDAQSLWKGFKWLINLAFIGLPWNITVLILNAVNIFLNIDFNTFWAGGNIYLMFNTYYLVVQSIYSVLLVYEFPFWLRHFKPIRLISLAMAFSYNFIYVLALIDFIQLLYVYDKKKTDLFQLFESMFFGYNLILHATIFPVNMAIMLKELLLEFFQLNQKRKGVQDNLNLGFADVTDPIANFVRFIESGGAKRN